MIQIEKFVFNHIEENTFVVYDESKEAVIIDCGAYTPEEKNRLKQFISDKQLKIKHLLNTHLHLDHCFGNQFIFETYEILPEYHQSEESMPALKQQAGSFGMIIREDSPKAVNYINEGDLITFDNTEFKAILVPGHSPGSLCFYSEKDACLFSGDVLFEEGIGRSDLWGGNYNQLVKGIKEKLLTLPENTVVYPGHGPSTTIQHEKFNNPFY